eukprot:14317875-Alexandrium_andersonii.AAC.1
MLEHPGVCAGSSSAEGWLPTLRLHRMTPPGAVLRGLLPRFGGRPTETGRDESSITPAATANGAIRAGLPIVPTHFANLYGS